MKRKEYIQPELAIVEVELHHLMDTSPGSTSLSTSDEPIDSSDGIGSREDGFFGF